MNKRRLSKQQQQRIEKNQQTQLAQEEQQALVIARYARHVDIQPLDAPEKHYRCHVRSNIHSIAVGDIVSWQEEKKANVVTAVFPRRSLIERPDGLGKLKPIAANIDQLFIVLAPEPEPHLVLLDRYLLAAENAGIKANIVLNKSELLSSADAFDDWLAIYKALHYDVFIVSCYEQQGFAALTTALQGKTNVFVGQSGVGKSSIVNALLPEIDAPTGELSESVQKGRHTTTTSKLFNLPQGGYLIDSPGIREFHLNHLNTEQIFAGFRELHPILGQCQFRNCQHNKELGCAIQSFIESDKMHPSRANSLFYILNQQE